MLSNADALFEAANQMRSIQAARFQRVSSRPSENKEDSSFARQTNSLNTLLGQNRTDVWAFCPYALRLWLTSA